MYKRYLMNSCEKNVDKNIECDAHPLVLVVDDDSQARMAASLIFQGSPVQVLEADTLEGAYQYLAQNQIHALLLDRDLLEGDQLKNGMEEIPRFLSLQPHLQIIMHTACDSTQSIVEAMRLGAYGYVIKGEATADLIREQIFKAISFAKLKLVELRQNSQDNQYTDSALLVGKSRAIRALKIQLDAIAQSSAPVVLLGETGTGKTTIANYIHEQRRAYLGQESRPFFAINIASLSPELVERELFGNDEGAFTGATKAKPGFFELANNGTLFLDEIGDAPLDLQVKLLKVIEEGKFYRLGSTQERHVKFKLICATHRDLERLVDEKKFREDLYMRISTFPIRVPSLKDRTEDISDVLKSIIPRIVAENKTPFLFEDLPKDYLEYLSTNPVRGNVRGLIQQLTRLAVYLPKDKQGHPIFKNWKAILNNDMSHGPTQKSLSRITLEDIRSAPLDVMSAGFPGYYEFIKEIEGKLFDEAAAKFKSQTEIARMLNVSLTKVNSHFTKRFGRVRKVAVKKKRSQLNLSAR